MPLGEIFSIFHALRIKVDQVQKHYPEIFGSKVIESTVFHSKL